MIGWIKQRLSSMVHAGQSWLFSLLPRTKFDYAREVGSGYGSSVVMAPVKFIQRVFPEAPLGVKRVAGVEEEVLEGHPMVRLIRRPNGFYSGIALWRATIAAYILDGNAYWLKWRNPLREVQQLWWIPPWLLEPASPDDGSAFISHYKYSPVPGQAPFELAPSEVVHLRNGLDPRNPRKGMSDLHSVLREVFSDDEASNFTASVLRNMGLPGIVISPKQGVAQPDDVNAVKAKVRSLAGDARGEPLVMRGPTDVHQFAWSPAQMELSSLRDVSEERVCAVIGLPAAVVGFGAGLQQTKVGATMRELVQLAWISAIIPMQHAMAEDLENQLLPDFALEDGLSVYFDDTRVSALSENEREKAARINIGIQGGWIKVSEGRREFKYPVDPADEVYLRSGNRIGIPNWGPPPGGTTNE